MFDPSQSEPRQSPIARSRAARQSSPWLGSIALCLLCLGVACAWEPAIPRSGPIHKPITSPLDDPDVPLELNKTRNDSLNCPAGNCFTRYQVRVHAPGTLSIRLVPDFSDDETRLRVVFEDPVGRVIQIVSAEETGDVEVKGAVEPGPYQVLIQSVGGAVDYKLTATLRAGGTVVQAPKDYQLRQADQVPVAPVAQIGRPTKLGTDSAFNPKINFRKYRRYAFADVPQDRLKAPPGESIGNPFLDAEIQRSIRLELMNRGFIHSNTKESANFLISSHVGTRASTWWGLGIDNFSRSYMGYFNTWSGYGSYIQPHTYKQGTVVIDIIDVPLRELTWHGWSTETVSPIMDKRELIRQFVHDILDQFPPN